MTFEATEMRVGPGRAAWTSRDVTECKFEYRERDRTKFASWDPRETHVSMIVFCREWDEPAGVAITPEERERVYEGLWRIARKAGVKAMLENLQEFQLAIPVRWKRGPNGCMINIHDSGRVDYMQLGHLLSLQFPRDPERIHRIQLTVPKEAKWTYPEGEAIPLGTLSKIVNRLRELSAENLWIGQGRPWRVEVDWVGEA